MNMTNAESLTTAMDPSTDAVRQLFRGISEDCAALVILHDRELNLALIEDIKAGDLPHGIALLPAKQRTRDTLTLMEQAITDLPQSEGPALDALRSDYAAIYLNYSYQAAPYESVWRDEEHLTCQETMFEVRKLYAAEGLGVPNWRQRADDHLVYQLGFVAVLIGHREPQSLRSAARFMDEHLLTWINDFAEVVARRCETAFYAGLALFTAAYCDEIRDLLAKYLNEPRAEPTQMSRPARKTAVKVPPPTRTAADGPTW